MTARKPATPKHKTRIRCGGRWYLSTLSLAEVHELAEAGDRLATEDGHRVALDVVVEKTGAKAGILNTHVVAWEELS